jgi:hypothetical protein
MTPNIKVIACLVAMLFTAAAFAQVSSTQAEDAAQAAPSSAPVAYVYVSSSPGSGNYEINAYSASSTGKLTAMAGSPFPADVQYMAVNGKYLFGSNGVDIYSFSISSEGALAQVASIDGEQFNNPPTTGGPINVVLDHTGTSLYADDFNANGTGNNSYEFFSIDNSTGGLTYLGMSPVGATIGAPLALIADNEYAYGSSCYEFEPSIYGYKRDSDGTLSILNINPTIPSANNGDTYCPSYTLYVAPDTTGNVAIPLQAYNSNFDAVGAPQLAVYTADSSGNLTTTSTASNMPTTSVKSVTDVWASPSGKLLAVAGTGGLQVFHFNGASPITKYTGLLTTDEIDQVFWDNDNHLYALSLSKGQLFVFTVTTTSHSQASGSPYAITSPRNIIVLPK